MSRAVPAHSEVTVNGGPQQGSPQPRAGFQPGASGPLGPGPEGGGPSGRGPFSTPGALWDAGCRAGFISRRSGRGRPDPDPGPGPGRRPAAVHLTAGGCPRQLRLLAHFWRSSRNQTCQALSALVGRRPADVPLEVTGVVVLAQDPGEPRSLPLPFRVRMDLAARTATVTHGRTAAGEEGSVVCVHLETLTAASLTHVLAPLLARRLCPGLFPQNPPASPPDPRLSLLEASTPKKN